MGILAVEVDGGEVVPRAIAGYVDTVVFGGPPAAAGTADAYVGVVPNLGAGAIDGDERQVLLGVAASVEGVKVGAHLALGAGENEAQDRLIAGVVFVIDLIMGVGELGEHAVEGRGRPGARARVGIGGLKVEFHDGALGKCGKHGAKETVARQAVAVRAVVEHVGGG